MKARDRDRESEGCWDESEDCVCVAGSAGTGSCSRCYCSGWEGGWSLLEGGGSSVLHQEWFEVATAHAANQTGRVSDVPQKKEQPISGKYSRIVYGKGERYYVSDIQFIIYLPGGGHMRKRGADGNEGKPQLQANIEAHHPVLAAIRRRLTSLWRTPVQPLSPTASRPRLVLHRPTHTRHPSTSTHPPPSSGDG